MKIMLVEDNEAIIMGLEYLLSQEGYQVVTARNIAEASVILAKEECVLILLDIGLPDGDGFELCRKIKRQTQTPVIFLTAREEETDVVKGLDMGADDYRETFPQPGTDFAYQRGVAQKRKGKSGASMRGYCSEYRDRQSDALRRGDIADEIRVQDSWQHDVLSWKVIYQG